MSHVRVIFMCVSPDASQWARGAPLRAPAMPAVYFQQRLPAPLGAAKALVAWSRDGGAKPGTKPDGTVPCLHRASWRRARPAAAPRVDACGVTPPNGSLCGAARTSSPPARPARGDHEACAQNKFQTSPRRVRVLARRSWDCLLRRAGGAAEISQEAPPTRQSTPPCPCACKCRRPCAAAVKGCGEVALARPLQAHLREVAQAAPRRMLCSTSLLPDRKPVHAAKCASKTAVNCVGGDVGSCLFVLDCLTPSLARAAPFRCNELFQAVVGGMRAARAAAVASR